ncbi:lysozyme family protein [Niallia sp. 03133]|uniref:lysozyme family protein n=1 Tax=Niallia sp. 03133 TaxID=3458060 RepID=UPI004043B56F
MLKKSAKTAVTYALLKSPIFWILAGISVLVAGLVTLSVFLSVSLGGDSSFDSGTGNSAGSAASLSKEVLRYEPLVSQYAEKKGIGKYTNLLLALIQQESGGRHLDVMQSSESLGLSRGAIMDPANSIEVGVAYFAGILKESEGDINLALQSYNFGKGFISYAQEHGGYSKEVAANYSKHMAEKSGWTSYGDIVRP